MAFRDGPFENFKVPLVWTAAVAVVAASVAAGFLLLTDKREDLTGEGYGRMRGGFDQVTAPAGKVLSAPVRWTGQGSDFIGQYFFAVRENRRLREQVAELESLRDANIALRNVNARYEALLKIRTQPAVPMATARAVSESRGPFVNARLIDAGTKAGIRVGNPVINEHGLVGRVVGATTGVSRVLLVTDVASRTPVLIDRTDARAIMVGDGGGNPRLEFVRGHGAIKEGDRILTSGDGGGAACSAASGGAFRAAGSTSWLKSWNSRMRTKSIAPRSENRRTRQEPSSPLAATPTGRPRGNMPPSPELINRIQQVAPARTSTGAPPAAASAPPPSAAAVRPPAAGTGQATAATAATQRPAATTATQRPAATTAAPRPVATPPAQGSAQATSRPPAAASSTARPTVPAPAPASARKAATPPATSPQPATGTPQQPGGAP